MYCRLLLVRRGPCVLSAKLLVFFCWCCVRMKWCWDAHERTAPVVLDMILTVVPSCMSVKAACASRTWDPLGRKNSSEFQRILKLYCSKDRWFVPPFWVLQIVISAFVLLFPAIPFHTGTICARNYLHPSSNREPILADISPGLNATVGFDCLEQHKALLFCSCTWLTMASARHFLLRRHRLHPLRGHIFPNEFDYCKSGRTRLLKDNLCL